MNPLEHALRTYREKATPYEGYNRQGQLYHATAAVAGRSIKEQHRAKPGLTVLSQFSVQEDILLTSSFYAPYVAHHGRKLMEFLKTHENLDIIWKQQLPFVGQLLYVTNGREQFVRPDILNHIGPVLFAPTYEPAQSALYTQT